MNRKHRYGLFSQKLNAAMGFGMTGIGIWAVLIPALTLPAAGISQSFEIKYISKDNVYLKGGSVQGLAEGDTLNVYLKKEPAAILLAAFVSKYSASCVRIHGSKPLFPGLKAILAPKQSVNHSHGYTDSVATRSLEKEIRRLREYPRPMRKLSAGAKQVIASIRGYAAYQHTWEFPDDSLFSADRQQYRLYLGMRGLLGSPLNFKMSLSSYKYSGRNATSAGNQWDERLSTFAFHYESKKSPVDASIGRLSPRVMSGVGYIDGGILTLRNNAGNGISVFGGQEPNMLYYPSSNHLRKYGGYATWRACLLKGLKLDTWIGWAGEYMEKTISREYLYIETETAWNTKLRFKQSGEYDINRGWRGDKEGQSLSVTNLYLNLSWRPADQWNVSIQYDTRKRFYEYQMRTLADSLLDLSHRDGWRANLSCRMTNKSGIYVSYSLRELSGRSGYHQLGNLGLNRRDLFWKNLIGSVSLTGNRSQMTKGYMASAHLRHTFPPGNTLHLEYGLYESWTEYGRSMSPSHYRSQTLRIGGNLEFLRRFFASGLYEYALENRGNRHRINAESGYRF